MALKDARRESGKTIVGSSSKNKQTNTISSLHDMTLAQRTKVFRVIIRHNNKYKNTVGPASLSLRVVTTYCALAHNTSYSVCLSVLVDISLYLFKQSLAEIRESTRRQIRVVVKVLVLLDC